MLIKFVSPPYDMLSYYSVVYLQCLRPTTTVAAFLYLSDKIYLALCGITLFIVQKLVYFHQAGLASFTRKSFLIIIKYYIYGIIKV